MKRAQTARRTSLLLVAIVMVLSVAPFLLPVRAAAAEKPLELRFTTVVTTLHPNYKAYQSFADEANKRTGGKVHITVYPSGTLNPPFETYNAIKTGMAQMGAAPVGYSAPVLPLNKLFGDALRGMTTAKEATRAYATALKSIPEMMAEYEGVHLLWVYSTLPLSIGTAKKPITRIEDFKGLVMRFPPGLEPLAKAWGATPISVAVGDIYVALQKGTVQGFFGGSEMLQAMRLAEHTKYVTSVDMVYGLSYVAVNKKAWDALPPDVQKVMDGLGEWAQGVTVENTDAAEKASLDFAKSQGTQIVRIEKAELAKLYAASDPVFDKMAAELEGRGKPGKKVLAEVDRLSKE
jgi:TRAP-type C4-dicarboxylate transport system substrate-binding protein